MKGTFTLLVLEKPSPVEKRSYKSTIEKHCDNVPGAIETTESCGNPGRGGQAVCESKYPTFEN